MYLKVTPLTMNTSKDDLNMPTTRLSQQFSTEPPPLLARNSLQTVSSFISTSFSTPATAATTAASSPIDDGKKAVGVQETHEPEPYKLDQLLFGM
jgi:hypothetical protein